METWPQKLNLQFAQSWHFSFENLATGKSDKPWSVVGMWNIQSAHCYKWKVWPTWRHLCCLMQLPNTLDTPEALTTWLSGLFRRNPIFFSSRARAPVLMTSQHPRPLISSWFRCSILRVKNISEARSQKCVRAYCVHYLSATGTWQLPLCSDLQCDQKCLSKKSPNIC